MFDKNVFYGKCISGDVLEAMAYLELFKEQNGLLEKYKKRFIEGETQFTFKTEEPFIKDVLKIYYDYYIRVCTKKLSASEGENFLQEKLSVLLGMNTQTTNIDTLEDAIEEKLRQKGYYFLGGITTPFRGPYIWKEMEEVKYEVELPSGIKAVKVCFMSEFISNSWLDFITFGEKGTGGWATSEGLYCKKDCYDTDTPSFLISYLKHEAQHFDDYATFPHLKVEDLEYRAKLVELMSYPDESILKQLYYEANKNAKNPHARSSYRILEELSNAIFKKSYENNLEKWIQHMNEVRDGARKVFEKHTKMLLDTNNITSL